METPMTDKLRRLSSHLHNMDSGSGEGKLLWEAADMIAAQDDLLAKAGDQLNLYAHESSARIGAEITDFRRKSLVTEPL
jgi:hypothetical protein